MSGKSDKTVTFEDFGHENGMKFWWATEYSRMLGYAAFTSFMKPINKAIQACMAAKIDYYDDFIRDKRLIDDSLIDDFKLSRFACYLIAMNADAKKPQVAKAQVYFADQVEKINVILEGNKDLERLQTREEIKIGNVALNSAAKQTGVENFGFFHDAGYKGLYNTGIKAVKKKKGIPEKSDHFDFMGRTELAANLFRITLTEEKLKHSNISGERAAMNVHKNVGKEVRNLVIKNTGVAPENLKAERRLTEVKKELKKVNKALNKKNTGKR